MKLQFPQEYNNNDKIYEKNCSLPNKEINKKVQYEYLKKYKELFGNSFSDIELLDIFERNNYIEQKIIKDIKVLLSIEKDKHFEDDDNTNHSPSFEHNFNSKSTLMKNNYEQNENNNFQNDSGIPSDYPPPPKEMDNTNIKNNKIYRYKKELFKKLKSASNTYKGNKNHKDEISYENNEISKTEFNINKQKKIQLIEIKNNNNVSPSPKYKPIQRKNLNDIDYINEDKKKLYQYFFMNMKNYSKKSVNSMKKENLAKSPDFEKKNNLFDIIPEKNDFDKQKIKTYKKGMNNYYINKRTSYNYLKITFEVNSIFIPACYNNPQRDQFLKLINEKRKDNPDKVIEFLFPQIAPSMYQIPFYPNLYPSYNQFNPYMNNIYGMPTQFSYPLNNSINNIQNIQNINDTNNLNENTNNIHDSLNKKEVIQLNNNNIQVNNQQNNNLNNNSSSINNIVMNNYSSHKSSGNISNSGNINTTSSFK